MPEPIDAEQPAPGLGERAFVSSRWPSNCVSSFGRANFASPRARQARDCFGLLQQVARQQRTGDDDRVIHGASIRCIASMPSTAVRPRARLWVSAFSPGSARGGPDPYPALLPLPAWSGAARHRSGAASVVRSCEDPAGRVRQRDVEHGRADAMPASPDSRIWLTHSAGRGPKLLKAS